MTEAQKQLARDLHSLGVINATEMALKLHSKGWVKTNSVVIDAVSGLDLMKGALPLAVHSAGVRHVVVGL